MAMLSQPTPKQKLILDFVVECFQDHGFHPTLREIGRRFNVSVGTAQDQLQALEAKGYIKRQAGLARGFSLTGAAPGLQIPILGRVGAGAGILAMEDIEGEIVIDAARIPKIISVDDRRSPVDRSRRG